jgi:hypothetical protein
MELPNTLLEGSMKGWLQKNAIDFQLSMSKVGGWTHFFALGHSSTHVKMAEHKFFYYQPPNFWCWKLEAKCKFFCFGPCWSFRAPTLEVPRHANHKKFWALAPTFDAEGWRLNTKKLASTLNGASKKGWSKLSCLSRTSMQPKKLQNTKKIQNKQT